MTSSARSRNVSGMGETEGFGGSQIEDEVEAGWLLDRNIGRFCAIQNTCHPPAAARAPQAATPPLGRRAA